MKIDCNGKAGGVKFRLFPFLFLQRKLNGAYTYSAPTDADCTISKHFLAWLAPGWFITDEGDLVGSLLPRAEGGDDGPLTGERQFVAGDIKAIHGGQGLREIALQFH